MEDAVLKDLREKMIVRQLIPRGISCKNVLDAFKKVPRHHFVPDEMQDRSYDDYPLPIGSHQTISQPYMVALMTQSLGLKGGEKVLEIGTGSGYQTAILAEIAKEVYSVERIAELSEHAKKILDNIGYENITLEVGDGTLGWPEYAPYDAIIVTAGAPGVPESLAAQLKDGGRLVIPIGSAFTQALTVIEKKDGQLRTEEVCGCAFVPLVGKEGWAQ